MNKYQQKNTPDGPKFDTMNGNIVVHIDALRAYQGDPVELFTKEALNVAGQMLAAWEAAKDSIEPVEGGE